MTALINISSSKSSGGSLFDALGVNSENGNGAKSKVAILSQRKNNLATAPLADPVYVSMDEYATAEEYAVDAAYYSAPTMQNQILLASYTPAVSGSNGRETKSYTVQDGDTVSSIAAKHGVTSNTILWANDLSDTSIIKPGDKLSVLPVTGVKYKVQKGDSLDSIATKFNSDKQKVLAYNEIPADEKLKEGEVIILPDGYVSPPASTGGTQLATGVQPAVRATASYATASVASIPPRSDSKAGKGHRFPYGYCTWYVAQRKYVPWGGNAGAWLANARATGASTGRTPKAGSIVVTGESRWGHVAIVEKVNGNSITVSEMNYAGFGKKSTRTLNANSRIVKGFIY